MQRSKLLADLLDGAASEGATFIVPFHPSSISLWISFSSSDRRRDTQKLCKVVEVLVPFLGCSHVNCSTTRVTLPSHGACNRISIWQSCYGGSLTCQLQNSVSADHFTAHMLNWLPFPCMYSPCKQLWTRKLYSCWMLPVCFLQFTQALQHVGSCLLCLCVP